MKRYFVTAIGTDSGKTVVSAILCRALQADYWKPVQAGRPTDTNWVRKMIQTNVFPEQFLLNTAASPHYAAEVDDITIHLNDFTLPDTSAPMVIEGAGGIMVPLNETDKVIDLATLFDAEVILVCDIYLGSINHSLLSIDYLKRQNLPVAGIIFNGEETPSTESIIESHCPWPVLMRLRREETWTTHRLDHYANQLKEKING